jgi:hypothetical protein
MIGSLTEVEQSCNGHGTCAIDRLSGIGATAGPLQPLRLQPFREAGGMKRKRILRADTVRQAIKTRKHGAAQSFVRDYGTLAIALGRQQ